MKKTVQKIVVNALTVTRVIATFAMPILFNVLSTPTFLLIIGLVLLTDSLDGILARSWEVSTLFGSFLDMGADKLFAISILSILTIMYPVMVIPLLLEFIIAITNVIGTKKGGSGKSSQLGRVKTWALGLSMFTLLLVGLSPDLSESLNSIKIDNSTLNTLANTLSEKFKFIDSKSVVSLANNTKEVLTNASNNLLNFIVENKNTIEKVSISMAIIPETIVASDYTIKSLKTPNKSTKKKIEVLKLLKSREFLKEVLFNEQFYKENKDKTLVEILDSDEVKKLTLTNK